MKNEYRKHLNARAFCKPPDSSSPTVHPLFRSIAITLEFTWPKWMILATLYGPNHPDLAMMRSVMVNEFGQADDLTAIDLRKHEEDALETCQDEAALNVDDFFDLLDDVCEDGTAKSDNGKMETSMSTPAIVHSALSVPVESDGPTILQRATGSNKDMLQQDATTHSSSSFATAPQEPETLDTLRVKSNLPPRESSSTQSEPQTVSLSDFQALSQQMKALETKMASDTSVLLNQRVKVLETHMDSDTSVLLYHRVEALETHLDSDTTTLLNQRVKALETRMASETSALLDKRIKALETRMDSDTSSLLDRRVKALETKIASGPSASLSQQVGKLESRLNAVNSGLTEQLKAHQKSISILKDGADSERDWINDQLDKIKGRLDKITIRLDRVEGRLSRHNFY
ncbi:hypothetical protein BGZ61DRAFT_453942 [Ilyonectria robusta]|uniref:uncharacterized protein n=1 Tax=Ilyonectria robusta TaxID=1079257 RepID=UPI001E8EA625|nr:uncharacterized protein BGZ61DRAFT_453942 [Ilyonectria robusta]KAH8686948.1 hypothetical protein BGZ61DRAFT_453942 [Ilyonectria robusta]